MPREHGHTPARCIHVTTHPLGSPYVRDQLAFRALPANPKRSQPEGEFILYWMQSTHRLEENWALRLATIEADRLGRPLLIVHCLGPTYEHASDRFHAFVLEGARDMAERADALGLTYRFALRRKRNDDRRLIHRLAARACLVVTDLMPTDGVDERTRLFADHVSCRVIAVESSAVVPSASFPREEYAARTMRPKIEKLLEHSLEPVEDRAAKRAMSPALLSSLDADFLDLTRLDLPDELARCEIDHTVGPTGMRGGLTAARARLRDFLDDGLVDYGDRRRDPSDEGGSSRLSPYLHHGHIAASEVARAVLARGPADQATSFLNEMIVWRELALNFCLRNPEYRNLGALPDWARRSMEKHEQDPREFTYTLDELERGETHDDLWNAGQRELVQTGAMHNVVRMLWGKSVLTWTTRYADALSHLIYLNDRYALDGKDPNSYAGIQWCFGKFDRPFASRPVWGTIRPMSLERARRKGGMETYVRRWTSQQVELPIY